MKKPVMKFRHLKLRALCLVSFAWLTASASAFSLLGPFTAWQVNGLGYGLPGDLGGPMNLGEGFRWNVPLITYACDASFINYFGPEGVRAIDEAMDIFNQLDAPSKLSPDLSEYSLDTLRQNYEATTLGIVDLKSTAMHLVMEELGFADPIHFAFTLRGRQVIGTPPVTNYLTIQRSFDPQTLLPSRYVNGVLYGYRIQEFMPPPFQHADAIEEARVSDLSENIPVATGFALIPGGDSGPNSTFQAGLFRTGLTRDDVGAIRYLYHPRNYAVESLLPGISLGGSISPYAPFIGTNVVGVTNTVIGGTNLVTTGLRGGRNKLKFKKAFYDPILSTFFTPQNSAFTDVVVSSNRTLTVQPVTRLIVQPDIVFSVGDLGLINGISPVIFSRTATTGWINNDALNGVDPVNNDLGPGVIPPQVVITFTSLLPTFLNPGGNAGEGFPNEETGFSFGVWGSFDGSTNAPIIYPKARNISINQLRNVVLHGAPLP